MALSSRWEVMFPNQMQLGCQRHATRLPQRLGRDLAATRPPCIKVLRERLTEMSGSGDRPWVAASARAQAAAHGDQRMFRLCSIHRFASIGRDRFQEIPHG